MPKSSLILETIFEGIPQLGTENLCVNSGTTLWLGGTLSLINLYHRSAFPDIQFSDGREHYDVLNVLSFHSIL